MSRSAGFASARNASAGGVCETVVLGLVCRVDGRFAWAGRRRAMWLAYGLRGASWAESKARDGRRRSVGLGRFVYIFIYRARGRRGAMGWAYAMTILAIYVFYLLSKKPPLLK